VDWLSAVFEVTSMQTVKLRTGDTMSLGEISRERIRDQRPIRSDGSIHLIAGAWAVRGRVPR
jgi:hypothetical protein